jgi:hypothetical protein
VRHAQIPSGQVELGQQSVDLFIQESICRVVHSKPDDFVVRIAQEHRELNAQLQQRGCRLQICAHSEHWSILFAKRFGLFEHATSVRIECEQAMHVDSNELSIDVEHQQQTKIVQTKHRPDDVGQTVHGNVFDRHETTHTHLFLQGSHANKHDQPILLEHQTFAQFKDVQNAVSGRMPFVDQVCQH